ncbi:MAG: ABC transporter permease, partial [Candidatus Caldatribacteriaceae bacterium]
MVLESLRLPRVKFRWEWLLFGLIVGTFVVNVRISPRFWSYQSFMDALTVFLEAGFMVLPMV